MTLLIGGDAYTVIPDYRGFDNKTKTVVSVQKSVVIHNGVYLRIDSDNRSTYTHLTQDELVELLTALHNQVRLDE